MKKKNKNTKKSKSNKLVDINDLLELAYGGKPINIMTPGEQYVQSDLDIFKNKYEAEKAAQPWKIASDITWGLASGLAPGAASSIGSSIRGMSEEPNNPANYLALMQGGLDIYKGMKTPGINGSVKAFGGITGCGGPGEPPCPDNVTPELLEAMSRIPVGETKRNGRKITSYKALEPDPNDPLGSVLGQKEVVKYVDLPKLNLGIYSDKDLIDVDYAGEQYRFTPGPKGDLYKNPDNMKSVIDYITSIEGNKQIIEDWYKSRPEFYKGRDWYTLKDRPAPKRAFGGPADVPVEIEGEEVGEMPNGQLFEAQGPSHEQGGIPASLPPGTEMYSKRIKIDGVPMSDRKKKRKKKTVTLEELLDKNNTDVLIKNALNRTQFVNEQEEQADTKIQELVGQLLPPPGQEDLPQHAYGDIIGKPYPFSVEPVGEYNTPTVDTIPVTTIPVKSADISKYLNTELQPTYKRNNPDFWDLLPGRLKEFEEKVGNKLPTMGDIMGMYGKYKSYNDPLENLYENRAGDTPNINYFKDYGKAGLEKLEQVKDIHGKVLDNQINDLTLSRNSSQSSLRNSARGINTLRALDLASQQNYDKGVGSAHLAYDTAMANSLALEANALNAIDAQVMGGEANRDMNDRKDRDNFYTERGKLLANKGLGIQHIAKDLNDIKGRNRQGDIISQMRDLGYDSNQIRQILEIMYKLPGTQPLEVSGSSNTKSKKSK